MKWLFWRKKTDEELYNLCSFRKETHRNGRTTTYITPDYDKLSLEDLLRLHKLMNKIFCQRSSNGRANLS